MSRQSYRVTFEGGSGFELAGIIDRPDQEAPPPVCVFSHCFTCNKDLKAIVRISRGLAERGVAVLRYDMTGLGGSKGDFSRTNFSTNVADLHSAIRFATSAIGPVTAMLGHSFGGAASLAVAGSDQSPAALGAVITLAAPSDTHHLARLLATMDPMIESRGVGSVSIGGFDWTIRREMLEDLRQHDLTSAIPRIMTPALMLHSPDDKTVSFDHALRIMGLLQNAAGRDSAVSLVSLPGADHLLLDASDIAFVTELVAAFIRRYGQP